MIVLASTTPRDHRTRCVHKARRATSRSTRATGTHHRHQHAPPARATPRSTSHAPRGVVRVCILPVRTWQVQAEDQSPRQGEAGILFQAQAAPQIESPDCRLAPGAPGSSPARPHARGCPRWSAASCAVSRRFHPRPWSTPWRGGSHGRSRGRTVAGRVPGRRPTRRTARGRGRPCRGRR